MEYLLGPSNLKILEAFCLEKTLFAFDYDGTLAPLTDDPDSARMIEGMANSLRELNQLSGVAIITGRQIDDVKNLLPIEPLILIGNHGSEGTQSSGDLSQMKEECRIWLDRLSNFSEEIERLGVRIEDKGFSLTLHYRGSSTPPEIAEAALLKILESLPRAKITRGKLVLNVLPEISINKGKALEITMREKNFQYGIYFGDDDTDEDVFRYNNSKLLTVKIGEEASLARFYLKNQTEMGEVLKLLKGYVQKSKLFQSVNSR